MDDMKGQFDQYETIGIIVPGFVVLVGLAMICGKFSLFAGFKEISVGGLGFLAICAFVIGHFTDLIGVGIQWIWWSTRGAPTSRILRGKFNGFDDERLKELSTKIN